MATLVTQEVFLERGRNSLILEGAALIALKLTCVGVLSPNNLTFAGTMISQYLNGKPSPIVAKGLNSSVPLWTDLVSHLSIQTTLQGPLVPLIKSLTITQLVR